jgi:dynamin 1-like protein
MIYDELHRLARQCETPELGRFPALRDHVMEIVEGMLRRCVKPTQQMISDLIRVELAYINTSHPDFIGGKQALAQVTKKPSHAQGLEAPTGSNITNDVVNPGPSSSSSTANTTAANANSNPPAPPQSPIPTNLSQFVDKTNGTNQNQGQNQGTGFFGMFRPQITPNGSNNTSSSLSDSPRANESHINGNTAYPPLGNVTVRNRNSARTPVPNRHQESSDTLSSNNYGLIKLPQMPEKMRVTAGTNDWGRREVEVIKTLVTSYFNVVRKGFIDLVPKMVMHFLVNGFRETLQNELVAQLYRYLLDNLI